MSRFKDKTDREWTLDINLDSVELVKNATNVSIYELTDNKAKGLADLLCNLPVLAHVCYILGRRGGGCLSARFRQGD
jgi:hypothetical protein